MKPHKVWGETFGYQKRYRLVCWDCMKNDDPARIPKEQLYDSPQHSTVLQNHKLWYDRVFSVESDGEGPRSKFEREDGQTDGGKTGTCEHLWRHGAKLVPPRNHSKVTRLNQNIRDQPESARVMWWHDADTTMTAIVISLIIVTQSSHDASNLDPMSQEIFVTFWNL